MTQLVPPHGGQGLKPLLIEKARLAHIHAIKSKHQLTLSSKELGDLLMMGMGAFTPLSGFMSQADWQSVCENMRLSNGLFWPIPITLSCTPYQAAQIKVGDTVELFSVNKTLSGLLHVADQYKPDKNLECEAVFGTTDPNHPGVKQVMAQGDVYLGGQLEVLTEGVFKQDFPTIYLTPEVVRKTFIKRGWSNVVAFQTRNPMHRSHEFLTKIALETCDGVLIHSILGQLKSGDIPAKVRIEAITKLVDHYYMPNTVLQAGYPMDMRYAGPKEALLHALFRQNFGCAYLIVGRDHAGVGDYYGAFDAQAIFDQIPTNTLEIKPLKLDWTFWCKRCDGMSSLKTCPHEQKDRLLLSGTKLRELLGSSKPVPAHFTRPEVLKVLQRYYESL